MNFSYCILFRYINKSSHRKSLTLNYFSRDYCSRSELITRRNDLFDLEKKRQKESIGRLEKIDVNYVGTPESMKLVMNKNISTPYHCARHISEIVTKRSVVALLNGDTLWHMHRPLPDSCSLEFLHFNVSQPAHVNKIFWRSCSFLLGATANIAFKDKFNVQLHSFPSPNVRSGSFVYDVELNLDEWTPTQDELRVLSIEMIKIIQKNMSFEYLNVETDIALDMFKDNPHKSAQIPDIALHNNQKVTLYRVGDHIDISKGPMISKTGMIGRCTVAAIHKLNNSANLYRFQGVALPTQIQLNHFAYSILEDRAKNLNLARIPGQESLAEDHSYQPITYQDNQQKSIAKNTVMADMP